MGSGTQVKLSSLENHSSNLEILRQKKEMYEVQVIIRLLTGNPTERLKKEVALKFNLRRPWIPLD